MRHKTYLARLSAAAGFFLAASVAATAPANKCVSDGQITYQQGPCPTGQVRKPPTLEELNAKEKQRRATAAAAAATTSSAPRSATPAPAAPIGAFRCDGRQHCSQMKSCAEAKYFLANCPGVKMDGDHDGIPCELELCR